MTEDQIDYVDDIRKSNSTASLVIATVSGSCLIIGIIGNVFIIWTAIFHAGNKNVTSKTVDILTMFRSGSDIMSLTTFSISAMARQGYGIELSWYNNFSCKIILAFFCTTFGLSSSITVAISAARFLAVYKPFLYKECTSPKAIILVAIVILITNIVTFFALAASHEILVSYKDHVRIVTCGITRYGANKRDPYLYFIIMHNFLPPLMVIIILIMSVSYANTDILRRPSVAGMTKTSGMMANNIIALINLVDNMALGVVYIMVHFSNAKPRDVALEFYKLDFGGLIAVLPKAFNFAVLYATSQQFRKSLWKAISTASIWSSDKSKSRDGSFRKKRPYQQSRTVSVASSTIISRTGSKQKSPASHVSRENQNKSATPLSAMTLTHTRTNTP